MYSATWAPKPCPPSALCSAISFPLFSRSCNFIFPEENASQVCFPHSAHFWQWSANWFSPTCYGELIKGFGASLPFPWEIANTLLGIALIKGQWALRHPHEPYQERGVLPHKGAIWEIHSCFSIFPHPACLEDILLCLTTVRNSGAKAAFCKPTLLL